MDRITPLPHFSQASDATQEQHTADILAFELVKRTPPRPTNAHRAGTLGDDAGGRDGPP